ncbi:substrate-binding domain-containing protein [Streptomyces flaveolus]|uniref:substrate-binding domain-containing protein n=1 Tax=Streptomyces flaveolus TaxID=67297 RepID=UPI0036FD29CE
MTGYDPRGQANRALLVGVSEYDLTEPPYGVPGDLPAVRHNLNRLRDALRRGRVFREREITVCRSPDQVDFGRALRTAADEAEGVLLLYFAGHGAIPSAGDELFLQMRNASVVAGGHAVFPGAEMFTTVLTVLAASEARRIVVVLDCCFAGNAAWIWETFRDKRRVLLLMSVQANHRTDAGDPHTPTPFTDELVALLDDGDEEVWFRGLADAVRARMTGDGHRTVRGDAWEPQSRTEPEEDVLLAAGASGGGAHGRFAWHRGAAPGRTHPAKRDPEGTGRTPPSGRRDDSGAGDGAGGGGGAEPAPGGAGKRGAGAGSSGRGGRQEGGERPPRSDAGDERLPGQGGGPGGGPVSGRDAEAGRGAEADGGTESRRGPVAGRGAESGGSVETGRTAESGVGEGAHGGAEAGRGPEAGRSTDAGGGGEAGRGAASGRGPEAGRTAESGVGADTNGGAESGVGAHASRGEESGGGPEAGQCAEAGRGTDANRGAESGGGEAGRGTGAGRRVDAAGVAGTGGRPEAGRDGSGRGDGPGRAYGRPGRRGSSAGRGRRGWAYGLPGRRAGSDGGSGASDTRAAGGLRAGRWPGRVGSGVLLLVFLAVVGIGSYRLVATAGDPSASCAPALELRVLTDPDLETTVRAAADAYLTSEENTTGDGCRRSGITVYSAGAADTVAALRKRTGAWQEPRDDDTNPQRDVGPQPDVWIPGSRADAARVAEGQDTDAVAVLEPDDEAFAYSPIVLAVPQDIAAESLDERSGPPLNRMIDDLLARRADAEVRRPDPEFTDTGLLATVGLHATTGTGTGDPRRAESRVAQPGPPSPTAADLLCALPDDDAVDDRTAALVPEFLMKSGVGCDSARRTPRMAQYPGDVPGLEPVFVRVRWQGADRDEAARDDAAGRFRTWLTGERGREAFARDGFRSATGSRALLDTTDVVGSVLRAPSPLTESAGRDAMEASLEGYRGAGGPGRVLFLLDSSGSMAGRWEGPSGGPGLLKQSLGGLGARDEYGVWAVYGEDGDPYDTLLSFGRHARKDAERTIDRAAGVRDAQADPYRALRAALDDMERRGADDERPGLIVYVTDDEDASRLTGDRLDDVLALARAVRVPVAMVSLTGGGCDPGKPDARISEASGGRCLDADDDLGAALHDEVARTGTGED